MLCLCRSAAKKRESAPNSNGNTRMNHAPGTAPLLLKKSMTKITKENFASLRADLNMTAAEFAKLFGLGAGSRVFEIEAGRREISGRVAVIFRLVSFIHRRRLLKKFMAENE